MYKKLKFEVDQKISREESLKIAGYYFKYGQDEKESLNCAVIAYNNAYVYGLNKAYQKIKEIAKSGNLLATYCLGIYWKYGVGGWQDFVRGAACMQKVAKGSTGDFAKQAFFELQKIPEMVEKDGCFYYGLSSIDMMIAECYEKGFGVKIDDKKTLEYYKKAEGKNNFCYSPYDCQSDKFFFQRDSFEDFLSLRKQSVGCDERASTFKLFFFNDNIFNNFRKLDFKDKKRFVQFFSEFINDNLLTEESLQSISYNNLNIAIKVIEKLLPEFLKIAIGDPKELEFPELEKAFAEIEFANTK